MKPLKTFALDEARELRIYQDQDSYAPNPRVDFACVGEVFHWHRRYDIDGWNKISGPDDMPPLEDDEMRLPLYMYDHSGVRVSTGPFPCPWDSGQVGFIRAIPKPEDAGTFDLEEALKAEVQLMDHYLAGNVYYYEVITKTPCDHCGHVAEEFGDSCGGYFGELYDVAKQIWGELCPEKEFPEWDREESRDAGSSDRVS